MGIEEPNSSHPDSRHFLMKGDANSYNDSYPVKYEQMVGIYRGDKIENIGSFVVFLQSPAGWLCVIFVVFMTFFVPFVDNLIDIEKDKRYKLLMQKASEENPDVVIAEVNEETQVVEEKPIITETTVVEETQLEPVIEDTIVDIDEDDESLGFKIRYITRQK